MRTFPVMREISNYTRLSPKEQVTKLNTLRQTLDKHEEVQANRDGWKMQLNNELLQIQGRTLNTEKIIQLSKRGAKQESVSIFLFESPFLFLVTSWSSSCKYFESEIIFILQISPKLIICCYFTP